MTDVASLPTVPPERLLIVLQRLLACDALDVAAALTEVIAVVSDVLPAEKVDVLLYDPVIDSLVAVGTSPSPLAQRERQLGLDRIPLANQGRTVDVFVTGRPYRTGQADADPAVLPGLREGLGLRSMLMTPLLVQGERRGVLVVSTTIPDAYTPIDLAFLTTIAQWIGLVVQRAELVETVRQDVATRTHQQAASDLMLMLAHDVGNYLTPILGRIQMVRHRALREQRTYDLRDLDAAVTGVERVHGLVVDLMDSERMVQGLFHLTPTVVDLMRLVHETVSGLEAPSHMITITGPADLCLLADTSRLRQALENVLTNALKHTPVGGAVRLTCACEERPDGYWAVIRVVDQGPGIAPSRLATLTQRFVAHGEHRGLGLGLHLVHGILTAHGGTVTLESSVGHGMTVVLAVPGADPQSPACRG